MFKFTDKAYEIFTISKLHKVDVGVAYDMFRKDVENGNNFNTANALPMYDFAEAKQQWDVMTAAEKGNAYSEWHDFIRIGYDSLTQAYPDTELFDYAVRNTMEKLAIKAAENAECEV